MHSQVSLLAYESLAGGHGLLREGRAREHGAVSLSHTRTHTLTHTPAGGHIRLHGGRVNCSSLSLSLSHTPHRHLPQDMASCEGSVTSAHLNAKIQRLNSQRRRIMRQYVYFCTSKASKLSSICKASILSTTI